MVEDNIGDIFLVQEAIAAHQLDADVYMMNDGEQALQFFRQLKEAQIRCPDILLLDLNLPKTDGFQVLAQLRSSATCKQMPIIIMTSSAATTDINEGAAYNVNEYFSKPSTYTEFLAIGDIIKKHL